MTNLAPTLEISALDGFRKDLLAHLPGLLTNAIRGYRSFAAEPTPEDAKSFIAHQAACRAALAHIHLLIRLAECVTQPAAGDAPGLSDDHLEQLIQEAQAALGNVPPDA